MPSTYLALVSRRPCGRSAAKQMDRVAARHGAVMVEARMPDGYRRWWEIPAGVAARQTEADIRSDLRAAGILDEEG